MHPVESADVAALWAREVADTVVADLGRRPSPSRTWVQLATEDPVAWVWPNRLLAGETPTRLQLRTRHFTSSTTLQALSPAGDVLASGRLRLTTPNRSLSAPAAVRAALGSGGAQLVRLV